jgi:hypothetical protein
VHENCRLVVEIQEPIQGPWHCKTHGQMLQNYGEDSEDSKIIRTLMYRCCTVSEKQLEYFSETRVPDVRFFIESLCFIKKLQVCF